MIVNFITTAALAGTPYFKLEEIFKAPLIVGASVSADYQTQSPGKRLALRYTEEKNIHVMAQRGKPGKEVLQNLKMESLKDRTAIVGLDLFFWDSFNGSPMESLKAMEKLFKMAKSKNIPLVLGEVPELVPFYQKSVFAINDKMKELCQDYSSCKILPLNQILRKTLSDGFIVQGGKKYSIEALLPDGLHLATPASEYLADRVADLFSK